MPSVSVDVPSRYAGVTLGGFDPSVSASARAALEAMRSLVIARLARPAEDGTPQRPVNVVLIGPPGVGKSHLAAAAMLDIGTACLEADAAVRHEFDLAEAAHREAMAQWRVAEVGSMARPIPPRHPRPSPRPVWVNVPGALVDMRHEFGSRDDTPVTDALDELRSHRALVVLDDLGREKASDWTAEVLYVLVNDRYEAGLPTVVTSNLARDELVAAGYWPVISRLAEDGILVEVKAPDHRLRRAS